MPTYEPDYLYDPSLEDFYTANFDSLQNPDGYPNAKFVISDFCSSQSFKSFLKNYVESRDRCWLISGEDEASMNVAFNMALREFDYDYVVYAASDTSVRDRQWLEPLLRDFDDPKVQFVMPTCTFGGIDDCEQSQDGPIDKDSKIFDAPDYFNLIFGVFPKTFLQRFDNRCPDTFDTDGTEYSLGHQISALGKVWMVNFRVNIIHNQLHPVRQLPDSANTWRLRHGLYIADQQKMYTRTVILPHRDNIIARSAGLIGRLRNIIKNIRRGGWRYFYFRFFGRQITDNFSKLDEPTKVAILKALFYRPESDYDQYTYSVHGSQSDDKAQRSADLLPAGPNISG